MHGILMSTFTDFSAFKSSLFKCNGKISRFQNYLKDECGFDREQYIKYSKRVQKNW